MFYLGLDLGQASDYTALAVLDVPQTARSLTALPPLHIRHLERFALGTSYPAIVERVTAMMLRSPLDGNATLIVDHTGVGRPVTDEFVKAGLKPIAITITGGDTATNEGRHWRVPKRDLVSRLAVALQTERLKVAQDLPIAAVLVQELLNFKVKITTAANDTYSAWRENDHDDIVLAVAMAVWFAEHDRADRQRRKLVTW